MGGGRGRIELVMIVELMCRRYEVGGGGFLDVWQIDAVARDANTEGSSGICTSIYRRNYRQDYQGRSEERELIKRGDRVRYRA